jgi:hypothetical protein
MRKSDQTIRDALKKAQAVLCQYLKPNGPNEKSRNCQRRVLPSL